MMLALATGCSFWRTARSLSAGGQLEQPSEVKSSTRTGVRVADCAKRETGRTRKRAAAGRRSLIGVTAIPFEKTAERHSTLLVGWSRDAGGHKRKHEEGK